MAEVKNTHQAVVILDMDDPYVSTLIKEEFELYRSQDWKLVEASKLPAEASTIHETNRVFRWGEYENLDWDAVQAGKLSTMWYMNRSGMIRKAQMAASIAHHISKCTQHKSADDDEDEELTESDSDSDTDRESEDSSASQDESEHESEPEAYDSDTTGAEDDDTEPESISEASSGNDNSDDDDTSDEGNVFFMNNNKCVLATNVPETYYFEITDPDELDELLICDLPEVAELGNYTEEENREEGRIWILKPSMTNQAKSIVMIPSLDKLRSVFEDEDALSIRQWVIQRYISNPLLISGGRKFHIRCHVFAVGALTVYLSTRMLALFSLLPFNLTDSDAPDSMHLTNVCYQKGRFVAANPDAAFDEKMAVLLMEEALAAWAIEHLYLRDGCWNELCQLKKIADQQAKHDVSSDDEATQATIRQMLAKSRSSFKFFAKSANVDIVTLCTSTRQRQRQAENIAKFALAHLQEQIQCILRELFAGCMGVHNIPPFVLSLGTSVNSIEDPVARESAIKETLKKSAGSIAMSGYRPLHNTSELYGIDFMVDDNFRVYLLEVNAGPDFGQTGARLRAKVCRPMVRGMSELITYHLFPEHAHREVSPFAASAVAIRATLQKRRLELSTMTDEDTKVNSTDDYEELEDLRDQLVNDELERLYAHDRTLGSGLNQNIDRGLARELIDAELAWLEGIDTDSDSYTRGGVEVNLSTSTSKKAPAVAHFLPVLHIEAPST